MAGVRQLTFMLAEPEKRLLTFVAKRLPAAVTSDHLTALGVVGALGTAVGFALTQHSAAWLWLASAMLMVQWFGDSLDGTLARVRNAERPKYGYYLDHVIDAFSTVVIGIGIGLSPYVQTEIALFLIVAYLILSINVYLETSVFGVFQLAYGKLGPTELRILLIAASASLFFFVGNIREGLALEVTNLLALLAAAGMLIIAATRVGQNLRRLAKMEPLKE